MRIWLITALALAHAIPATAQEWLVAREQFAFVGTRLTIEVDARTAGTLRLIRGEPGRVRVASRSVDGFTASGLDRYDRLTLSAAGHGHVDYLVSVPAGVRVSVRLPDRHELVSIGGRAPGQTLEWQEIRTELPVEAPLPTPDDDYAALFTTYAAVYAPPLVQLPELSSLRSITVRIEGHRFRVAASRPLSITPGSSDVLEVRPAGPPMDLALSVPVGTPRFTLRIAGATALTIHDGEATAFCPVTEQSLSDSRRWFTFNPVDGRLRCPGPTPTRHEG